MGSEYLEYSIPGKFPEAFDFHAFDNRGKAVLRRIHQYLTDSFDQFPAEFHNFSNHLYNPSFEEHISNRYWYDSVLYRNTFQ